jgi:hypothetical protein
LHATLNRIVAGKPEARGARPRRPFWRPGHFACCHLVVFGVPDFVY